MFLLSQHSQLTYMQTQDKQSTPHNNTCVTSKISDFAHPVLKYSTTSCSVAPLSNEAVTSTGDKADSLKRPLNRTCIANDDTHTHTTHATHKYLKPLTPRAQQRAVRSNLYRVCHEFHVTEDNRSETLHAFGTHHRKLHVSKSLCSTSLNSSKSCGRGMPKRTKSLIWT